jgi:ATP-dependent Lon protease
LVELPWYKKTNDVLDVKKAKEILDSNHYGMDKAKDRILEFIAVKSLKPKNEKQPILCFVGPPGTGKTSMGKSIANALNREFVRISLGGVKDEAEIRGHRRTYIGAMPGRIIQTIKKAGNRNPVFMLDEIDKLASDHRGDPSSALLEVLDPEQNNSFSDNYLEVPYDLSEAMFITTANSQDTIPWPLLDRMEIVEFNGYIEEEKIEISKKFLINRQLDVNGLKISDIDFSLEALQSIIRKYTYEAGVRNLERMIGNICRKIARKKAENQDFDHIIDDSMLTELLGPPLFNETKILESDLVGVATALAWTYNGGDIMPVEVLITSGKGQLHMTGSLGEIMQESIQAGLTYLKANSKILNIDDIDFEEIDVHIHVPEGAVPKDGPSAGITVLTAMLSAFTDKKVKRDVGMTGEITLLGRVLPIGGVKEKVLAASRAGIKTVILPELNNKDLIEIPENIKNNIEIKFVKTFMEVIDIALVK